ncbi:hypothetical protein GF340_01275 [Candidatus Peregrinibacteria bacterium]|nr:hypothetical protein [Candidatus Peregrinibacteria bacterium]
MKKLFVLITVAMFSIGLGLPLIADGATFLEDQNLTGDQTVNDNVYAFGQNPVISANVNGDVHVAGGNIVVTGDVTEDISAAGGTFSVTGDVKGDVRAVGGTITLDGIIDGEVMIAGGTVKIGPSAVLRKGIYATAGEVIIDENASIIGVKEIKTDEDGKKWDPSVEGKIAGAFAGAFFGIVLFWLIARIVTSLVVALGVMWIFPKISARYAEFTIKKVPFWKNLLYGFLYVIVGPIAIFFLFATGVGALLAGLLLAIYGAYFIAAIAFAGVNFGYYLKQWIKKPKKVENDYLWAILGIVLLPIICLIPIVGWLFGGAFFIMTYGSLVNSDAEMIKKLK